MPGNGFPTAIMVPAHGLDPVVAVHEAQDFTWHSLKYGYRVGMGQHLPNRLFWAQNEEDATP